MARTWHWATNGAWHALHKVWHLAWCSHAHLCVYVCAGACVFDRHSWRSAQNATHCVIYLWFVWSRCVRVVRAHHSLGVFALFLSMQAPIARCRPDRGGCGYVHSAVIRVSFAWMWNCCSSVAFFCSRGAIVVVPALRRWVFCRYVWRVACGVWRVACGVWRVACGV